MRPTLIAGFGPFIAAGLAVFFIDGHRFVWLAGMVTGLFVGAWIAFRDTPPHYVKNWHDGAEGERKTERVLRPLERGGWRTFHDLQVRYGNYDHIAVGPAGVFLLESKNLMGTVELRDGVPHLQRRLDPEAKASFERIRPRALAAAARLKDEIERRTGQRTWVQAVVVFWSEFPQGTVDDGRCVFLHGSKLRGWLEDKSARLSEAGVEAIAEGIARVADGEAFVEASTISPGLVRA
jgi:Nuclease-related domain